jgi:hypothetical protein
MKISAAETVYVADGIKANYRQGTAIATHAPFNLSFIPTFILRTSPCML